jgi:hypothetical protein
VHAAVVSVARAARKPRCLEALHDPRHRGRSHLFRRGELTEGTRPAEDEHRERRQLRRRDARGRIFAPNVPQRVDGGRMEAVGGFN